MTRANVVVKYKDQEIIFYRHCDGYPEGLGRDLEECIITEDPILTLFNIINNCYLEIASSIHDDIDYLYTVNLSDNSFITLRCQTYDPY